MLDTLKQLKKEADDAERLHLRLMGVAREAQASFSTICGCLDDIVQVPIPEGMLPDLRVGNLRDSGPFVLYTASEPFICRPNAPGDRIGLGALNSEHRILVIDRAIRDASFLESFKAGLSALLLRAEKAGVSAEPKEETK